MEPFHINLNKTEETSGRFKQFIIILSAITIVIAAVSYFLFFRNNEVRIWFFIPFLIYLGIFIYFAYIGYKAKIYFMSDEFAIEYQFGFFKQRPTTIIWETVHKVKIGPTYISFLKRSGRGKKLELGWLPYKKLVEIKERIEHCAQKKEIIIEIAEYNKL